MIKVKEDLTGNIYGRLTVICQAEDHIKPCGARVAMWLCECGCEEHNKIITTRQNLKSGNTQSCGCLRREVVTTRNKEGKKYNQYKLDYDEYGEYYVGIASNTGSEFYFDIDDYDIIKDYCWCEIVDDKGYHSITTVNSKNHRLIKMHHLLGCKNYDHIDRNPLNNRRNNLRPATKLENARNRTKGKNNKSGIIGVTWDNRREKWVVQLQVNKKNMNFGFFINKEDAIKIRLQAEDQYFGEFAPQRHLFEQYGISGEIKNIEELKL